MFVYFLKTVECAVFSRDFYPLVTSRLQTSEKIILKIPLLGGFSCYFQESYLYVSLNLKAVEVRIKHLIFVRI